MTAARPTPGAEGGDEVGARREAEDPELPLIVGQHVVVAERQRHRGARLRRNRRHGDVGDGRARLIAHDAGNHGAAPQPHVKARDLLSVRERNRRARPARSGRAVDGGDERRARHREREASRRQFVEREAPLVVRDGAAVRLQAVPGKRHHGAAHRPGRLLIVDHHAGDGSRARRDGPRRIARLLCARGHRRPVDGGADDGPQDQCDRHSQPTPGRRHLIVTSCTRKSCVLGDPAVSVTGVASGAAAARNAGLTQRSCCVCGTAIT